MKSRRRVVAQLIKTIGWIQVQASGALAENMGCDDIIGWFCPTTGNVHTGSHMTVYQNKSVIIKTMNKMYDGLYVCKLGQDVLYTQVLVSGELNCIVISLFSNYFSIN